jgi:hypothetical protein
MKAKLIHESLTDILKPKSEKEIEQAIDARLEEIFNDAETQIDIVDLMRLDIDPGDHQDFLMDIIDRISAAEFNKITRTAYKSYFMWNLLKPRI